MVLGRIGDYLKLYMRAYLFNPARLFAAIAICVQVLMPGMMAHASDEAGFNPAHLMCLPGQTLTQAEQAIVNELAEALGLPSDMPDKTSRHEHCALCAFSHAVPLTDPVFPVAMLRYERARLEPLYQAGIVHPPQGPPVGATGPPITL